ncbi:MAG TPA: hypothetical protein VGF28_05550 [Thermoanaerobaculia bacterium]|jgi:hypothetical protein
MRFSSALSRIQGFGSFFSGRSASVLERRPVGLARQGVAPVVEVAQSARWWVLFSFRPKWRSSQRRQTDALVAQELGADGGVDEVVDGVAEVAVEDAQIVVAAV